MTPFTGILGIVLVVFAIIVAILWIMMPFLIMGTNKRLDKLIQQNEGLLDKAGVPTERSEGMLERLAETLYKDRGKGSA